MNARDDYAEAIFAEQAKVVQGQWLKLVISGVGASLIMVWLFWPVVDNTIIVSWTLTFWLFVAVRVYLLYRYMRTPAEQRDETAWMRRTQPLLVVSGSIWGAAGILFFVPGQFEYQVFLILILLGACMFSMLTLAVYFPAFLCFIVPLIPAVAYPFIVSEETFHWAISLFAGLTLLIYINFGRYIQASFIEAQRLRFALADRNRELADRNRAVERANMAKTQFLAAASHDLRQPLHAMGLYVDAIDHAVQAPKARELIGRLRQSSDSLDELLDGLLNISKLDAGVITPNPRPFALATLLDKLHVEFEILAAEKNLRFRYRRTRAVVESDPELLGSVLRNVISNAIRYTKYGKILVGCRRRGPALSVEIWDTGIGIPDDQQETIFHEFVQLHNAERDRHQGLGLGLAIVKRTAELLGHRIALRSRFGRGTVFSVELPQARAPGLGPAADPLPILQAPFRDVTVLVIDDDDAIRHGMREVLSQWGCDVLLADSAAAAQVIVNDRQPVSLIIADYRLRGGHSGLRAISTLQRLHNRSVPAIVITGDTSPDRLKEAQAAGFPLLHKPVKPHRLRALMNHVLHPPAVAKAS